MLYIAGSDHCEQHMMNRPIDGDGDGDESYVSTEYCHGEKNGSRRMVSENRYNYMGSKSRDTHMMLKRRRNFDKDHITTDRDENALVCHDGHRDDVMYWYNPLGSIFNSREHYLNGNVSEENVAECDVIGMQPFSLHAFEKFDGLFCLRILCINRNHRIP